MFKQFCAVVAVACASGACLGQGVTDSVIVGWGRSVEVQTTTPAAIGLVVQIAAGDYHSVALRHNGSVLCWGSNADGQCNMPANLGPVKRIAAGYNTTIALLRTGSVACWGVNVNGECNVPARLSDAIQVAGGGYHNLALRANGTIVSWGWNGVGQCTTPAGIGPVKGIGAGHAQTIAIREDGSVWCWGRNDSGECNVPAGLSNIVSVSGGGFHSLARATDGRTWYWGSNGWGQDIIPSQVQYARQVGGGHYHCLALALDRTVQAWGADWDGQAQEPAGLAGVVQIAAGGYHNLALLAADEDGDGIDNTVDNCPLNANPLQTDSDNDGVGDVCENITTRYVPSQYATIQSAINASAPFDTVQVAAGTYAGPIDFMGKNIVVRGAGAADTIIQGTGGTNTSVVSFNGEPQSAAIEGVTIRGGLTGTLYPNTPPQYLLGGGIFMLNSAGSIRNCIIESNFSGFGGGAYVSGCTGTISNCIFRNNNASTDGGGIQLFGGAPKVVDTVVENNFANSRGGGMHVVQGTPELLRVNIRNNVSNNIVGGLSWYGLGSPSAFLKVTSCQVTGNSALVVQGGIGISSTSQANISILDSVACTNLPLPNISGIWENLGGNSVCKCVGDIVENGSVDGGDLAVLISQMQTSGGVPSADIDDSGFVDGIDLAMLLSAWGACPSNGSITSITPAVGPTSGGTAITITGIGFGNMTSVKVGGVAATNVVATSTTVTAVTPARTAGVVDVAVSGPGQYVVATSAFTYSSAVVPPWATLLEAMPNPAVVTDANLRAAIEASGFAWRIRDNSSNIEMLLVPAGTFTMGCSASTAYTCNSDENPTHQVTLTQAFYMGRSEVTQAQWTAKMGSNPSQFQGSAYPDAANRPVERASWNMIASGPTSFMSVTGLRLPTEAEWEYAYRAGTTTAFHSYPAQPNGFNDDTLLGNIAWYSANNGASGSPTYGTKPVGGKLANGLGLHDMSGNVWEWCQDWYGPYSSASVTNPTGPTTGAFRLLRGGFWGGYSYYCRASQRGSTSPGFAHGGVGFRVVRNP